MISTRRLLVLAAAGALIAAAFITGPYLMWVFVVGSDAVPAGICQLTQHFDAEPPRGGLGVGAGGL